MTERRADAPLSPLAGALLLKLAFLESLLAVYQWMELVLVRSGGTAICAVNETVNCATVWNSGFASRVHALLGMPVAGLGLVWGVTAFALSLRLVERALRGAPLALPVAAVRLTAVVGLLSCVTFAVGSVKAGALCLTCLLTFALVIGFAVVALARLPGELSPPAGVARGAALWSLGAAALAFLVLLKPGLETPTSGGAVDTLKGGKAGPSADQMTAHVDEFLKGLPWAEKQAVSDSLATYQRSPAPDTSRFATRFQFGPKEAPVRIVDFTDILCGHCRAFEALMQKLREAVPPGSFSLESRHFPLDSECNPLLTQSDGSGVRCLGAKAQICLEGAPDYWTLKGQLFEAQASLSKERILEIASSGSVKRAELEACIARPETMKKLADDVAYAALYKPEGTPLVLVNGREGLPSGAWLYAMTMVKGDVGSKVFAGLPPAR